MPDSGAQRPPLDLYRSPSVTVPTLSGESIICISWLNWDWLPLIPHQMMMRLAERNRVLYVDPPIALATFLAHPAQRSFLSDKVKRWKKGVRRISENLHVYYPPPLLVAPGHLRINDALNRHWLSRAVKRVARELGLHTPILWLYDPYVIEPRGQFEEKLVCYDCNDDTSSFASLNYKRRNMQMMDATLTRNADLVLTTSRELYHRKRELNPNVHYLPSGVDFELFNQALREDTPPPEELSDVSPPVVGYVGALTNYRIEWTWIEALAQGMPEATVVLVGPPVEAPPRSVSKLANVRFVGPKRPAELPRYLKRFDVGIIPYKGEAFLKGCQPTKTFEYLAAGLGVVSAPIPELEPYAAVVRFAANATEFLQQTRQMLVLAVQPAFRARCIEIAKAQTWDARIEAASELIRASLSRKADAALRPSA
jgi:glycosyltransferase involved in cell wall biosynthesis